MEDEFPEASIDELLEHSVAARLLTDTVRYSGGLELNVVERLRKMDLETINQVLKDDWSTRQLPRLPSFGATPGRRCVLPSMRDHGCCEIQQLDNW